jgi:RimJ/RimL family protein N-acetyltransferase
MDGIGLRGVEDADLDVFFEHYGDEVASRMAAFIRDDPDDRAAFDEHWARIRANPEVLIRTITLHGAVVGHIASFTMFGDREITYWIERAQWGRGVATAALARFIEEETTRPLFARAAEDNLGSRRVCEKCGFARVGEDRGFAKARGEEIAEVVMRLD